MELSTVLTSAVVAALIAGLISLRSSERKIQIENITQERAKWREKIRSNALFVHQAASSGDNAKLSELHLSFLLLLNPFDKEDQAILEAITALGLTQNVGPRLPEFAGRVSYLLKHDWDRAKHEAKPWPFRRGEPVRKPFA